MRPFSEDEKKKLFWITILLKKIINIINRKYLFFELPTYVFGVSVYID
jgi:hypothetical protein